MAAELGVSNKTEQNFRLLNTTRKNRTSCSPGNMHAWVCGKTGEGEDGKGGERFERIGGCEGFDRFVRREVMKKIQDFNLPLQIRDKIWESITLVASPGYFTFFPFLF
ncbi:hypothetical protein FF1_007026 [Malus domestica]